MAANDVRKYLNLFVDGQGLAGQIDEFNAPKLATQTVDFRAGGMQGPIKLNMGLESMDTDFSLFKYAKEVIALFGLAEGQDVNFTAREALESADGTVTPVQHVMRGRIVKMDPGQSKAGSLNPIKFELNLKYYKLVHGGTTIHEVDLVNMIHIVNGVDQTAQLRAALGI